MCDCVTIMPTAGEDGEDGISSYVYMAWAEDNIGTGYTDDPLSVTDSHVFMAFVISSTPLVPSAGTFAGRWYPFRGPGGDAGPPGPPGASGAPGSFLWPITSTSGLAALAIAPGVSVGDFALVSQRNEIYELTAPGVWTLRSPLNWNTPGGFSNTVTSVSPSPGGSVVLNNGSIRWICHGHTVFFKYTASVEVTGVVRSFVIDTSAEIPAAFRPVNQEFQFWGIYSDASGFDTETCLVTMRTDGQLHVDRNGYTGVFTPSIDATLTLIGHYITV